MLYLPVELKNEKYCNGCPAYCEEWQRCNATETEIEQEGIACEWNYIRPSDCPLKKKEEIQ